MQNSAKFRKYHLYSLVDFEKCCQTRIYLQNFVLIQPKTSEILPAEICQEQISTLRIPRSRGRRPRPLAADRRPPRPRPPGDHRPDIHGEEPATLEPPFRFCEITRFIYLCTVQTSAFQQNASTAFVFQNYMFRKIHVSIRFDICQLFVNSFFNLSLKLNRSQKPSSSS